MDFYGLDGIGFWPVDSFKALISNRLITSNWLLGEVLGLAPVFFSFPDKLLVQGGLLTSCNLSITITTLLLYICVT